MMNINQACMGRIERKEFLILFLCLLVGFALRFYTFDQKSLWIDEVHTFNDSRPGIKDHIKYFQEKPLDYLHPPLFFLLTHLFYPFEKPERDLRIIPLIFGVLSITMMYLLSRLFSPNIALPCTLTLTFMTYHISFSQDGRPYSLIMFLGMAGLYFFMNYLRTHKRRDLLLVAFLFAALFYISYSSIPFIVLSQILWFYSIDGSNKKPNLPSFLVLNSLILLLCLPWILFIAFNYKPEQTDIIFIEEMGSFLGILSGILNDWVPFTPLSVVSMALLILLPVFSKDKKNSFILLALFFLPVGLLYLFCKLFGIRHYFSSRYVINFLPIFFISVYLSLNGLEVRYERLKTVFRLRVLFIILFITSNMVILPLYYRSEKQDFRGLVSYLESQLRDGDKIFVNSGAYIPGILHYFGVNPKSRYYDIPFEWCDPEKKEFEWRVSLTGPNKKFTIYCSNVPLPNYVADGGRLWIIVGKPAVKETKERFPCVLRGYFDGSFCNFRRFPSDASMYLFLWDPLSPQEKGIDMPLE